jgi:hypothetical protein
MTARWLWVVCGLIACGDDGAAPTDGMITGDGSGSGSDGDTDTPVYEPVTVTYLDRGIAAENVRVLFQRPDGSVAADAMTDATGVATGQIPPGGSVTLVQADRLDTYVDVQPGDALRFGTQVTAGTAETLTATVPLRATSSYGLYVCGVFTASGTTSISVVAMRCHAPEEALAVVANATGLTGSIYVPSMALTGTTALAGPYVDPQTRTISITNAGAGQVNVVGQLYSPTGLLFSVNENNVAIVAGSATLPKPEPVVATALAVRHVTVERTDGDIVVMSIGAQTTSTAFDVAANTLPGASNSGTYDIAAHHLTWNETTGTVAPDVTLARLSIVRGPTTFQWNVLGSHASGTLALPALPSDVAAAPIAGDTVTSSSLLFAKMPTAPDVVRRTGLELTAPDRFHARGLHIDEGALTGQVLVRFVN